MPRNHLVEEAAVRRHVVLGFGCLVVAVLLASCNTSPPAARSSTKTHRSAASTAIPTTTSTPTTVPAFSSSVSSVTALQLGATWHVGCPVDPSQLRTLQVSYWGFDDQPHLGTIIVNASVVGPIIEVFSTLYAARFPIEEMVPEAAYGGDDNAAAAADDTSGFNCRNAVAPGPPQWSMHAYGEAIDVNDVQNPYVAGTTIIPLAGATYLGRSDVRPGMAEPGGTLVDAFTAIGWGWGGNWVGTIDYQHFSINGH
jgi:D-alanyl-D-alanine carboxypeptidase